MRIIIILLTALLLAGCSEKLEGPYKVTRVIDGDTIDLNNSNRIRFSGIN